MTTEGVTSIFSTRRFELEPWQQLAVDAWFSGDGSGPCRGTLEGMQQFGVYRSARANIDAGKKRPSHGLQRRIFRCGE